MLNKFFFFSQVLLTCLSRDEEQTKINSKSVTFDSTHVLKHKDIFTIGDRSFRWEYPEESQHIAVASPKKTPKKAETPKASGNNQSANGSVAKKGEGYGVMSPKAKIAAARMKSMSKIEIYYLNVQSWEIFNFIFINVIF